MVIAVIEVKDTRIHTNESSDGQHGTNLGMVHVLSKLNRL